MRTHTYESIVLEVETETGMSRAEFLCQRSARGMRAYRGAEFVRARRLLVMLLREFTRLGYKEIASLTTGRAHSTWVHAHASARDAMNAEHARFDSILRAMVARCSHRIAQKETTSGEEA